LGRYDLCERSLLFNRRTGIRRNFEKAKCTEREYLSKSKRRKP
jgi:hypothetical protein